MASNRASRRRPGSVGKRLAVSALVAAVVTGGAYGTTALVEHGRSKRPGPAADPSARTVRVERTDLSDTQTLPGDLGFGGRITVKGTGKGIVSKLPVTGSAVQRGKPLYWVDDQPVTVFYGDTPFFRVLDKPDVAGRDVTVLAENLRALGYDLGSPPPPAGRAGSGAGVNIGATQLTSGLLAALKRWQHDTGRQQTGKLDPTQAVVVAGPSRVDAVKAQLGDTATDEILSVTSEQKTVTVKVDAQSVADIHAGENVTITLPDTKVVPGTVVSVGTVVQGGGPDTDSDTTPSLQVTVAPKHGADVAKLNAAAVQVTFASETRKHVLVVPIGALLALSEGGYALQRSDGSLVGVHTGLIAKGLVEVDGDGVKEGDTVVTAS